MNQAAALTASMHRWIEFQSEVCSSIITQRFCVWRSLMEAGGFGRQANPSRMGWPEIWLRWKGGWIGWQSLLFGR
jgi:hypothetical protein